MRIPQPGDTQISAKFLERAARAAAAIERFTGEGVNTQFDPSGVRITARTPVEGFWTKLLGEDPQNPGNYHHVEQTRDVAADGSVNFTNRQGGIFSYASGGEIRFVATEVNGATGIGFDADGNRLKDSNGQDVYVYVWVKVGRQEGLDDGEFLFDHGNKNDSNIPTVVGFLYTFADRDPLVPTFIAQYRYSYPAENDPPFSCDPATGDTLQDADTGEYLLCEPGDYFVLTDDLFLFPNICTGGRGLAQYDDTFQTWDVVFAQQVSILATAFIKDNRSPGEQTNPLNDSDGMTGDLGLVSIESFRIMGFSPFNGSPTQYNAGDDEYEPPDQAYNAYALRGRYGDRVLLAWDDEDGQWVIIQVQHHNYRLLAVPVDDQDKPFKVKDDGITLQGKFIIAAVCDNGVAPKYRDLIIGTKCDGT